jgi:hypothetical protein
MRYTIGRSEVLNRLAERIPHVERLEFQEIAVVGVERADAVLE